MTLEGKRILLGRHQAQSSPLEDRLRQTGASVSCVPLIEVRPVTPIDTTTLRRDPHIVVITSKNSIDGYAFLRPLLSPHRLAVVGKRTGDDCRTRGFTPDFKGDGKGALALLKHISYQIDLAGKHILYPCSTLVSDDFQHAAAAFGATVQMIPVYRTEMPKSLENADLTGFDVAVFYSSSGAVHFHTRLPLQSVTKMAAVAMGEQTADTLRELGAHHVAVATEPNVDALYDAVVKSVLEIE